MPTLLDTIQKNMQQATTPQAMATTQAADQATSQANQLSQASTGKAAETGIAAPRATNLAAQVAAGQANLGAQQLATQAQIQGSELQQQSESVTQQTQLQNRELDEQSLGQLDSYANRATQIMGQLTRGNQQLNLDKQRSQVEQLGFNLRLSNDHYVHQLESEGRRSRLDNEVVFQEQLQNAVFADDLQILEQDMNFKEALNGKKNEWREYLDNFDIETAVQVAESERSAASKRAMWEGISTMASAGAGMATQKRPKSNSVNQESTMDTTNIA